MSVFNMNSGFWKFVNRALDVLWLNILWIVFSLPIVTIGASTCAAYYVSLKMVSDEEGYIGKMFIKAFKEDFIQGTLMWFITAPCIYLLYLLWQFVTKSDDPGIILILGAILASVVVLCITLYTYPMIARYRNSLKNIIRNSAVVCIQYFKKTVILVVLLAIEFVIIFWNKYTMIVAAFIGPEFIIFTISAISKQIFNSIESQ